MLHLLHVIPDPYAQFWSMETTRAAIPELLKTWEQDARTRLDKLKTGDVETTVVTQVGHPSCRSSATPATMTSI